ncbi:MAG: 16S rRNA (cytosine(1402)-N(4))-methyltransferase RsmH [Planctomycetaceae bacterium]
MSPLSPSRSADRARHRPVMVREVIRWLGLTPGLVVADGTVGAGGHSSAILPLIRPTGRLIGLDRDPMMLAHARQAVSGSDVELVHSSYADLLVVLDRFGVQSVDRVLLDLGLSSDQLADRERGFSFEADGPLDLRFDVSKGRPASEFVATASAADLEAVFRQQGEEPHADRVAQAIVAARSRRDVANARTLAGVIAEALPGRHSRGSSHPATRVFQALRIEVNDELGELGRMLTETLPASLASGGRAVIISFHSLEDRMVKGAFRNREHWRELTPKPIPPTPSEERMNPRSRTARLRAAIRI